MMEQLRFKFINKIVNSWMWVDNFRLHTHKEGHIENLGLKR